MHVISSYLKVFNGPGVPQVIVHFKPSFSYFHAVNSQFEQDATRGSERGFFVKGYINDSQHLGMYWSYTAGHVHSTREFRAPTFDASSVHGPIWCNLPASAPASAQS